MDKVLSDLKINSIEMNLLLDWFDKVRIGLWLMYFTLDNNWTDISPKFHIAKRIGQFDRFLHISKCNSTEKRLNFIGIQNFSFQMTPSVFGLVVNNFMFTNISYQGLISRRVGFPYIISEYLVNKNELDVFEVNLNEIGLKRIMRPIIRKQLSIDGNSFYQAIYNEKLIISDKSFTKMHEDNDYVKLNSLELGKSKIIYNNLFLNDTEEPIVTTSNFCYDDCYLLSLKLIKQVFELQLWLDQSNLKSLKLDKLDKEKRQYVKNRFLTSIKITKMHLELLGTKKV